MRKEMDDKSIDRMLVDIFRHWFQPYHLVELLNDKVDSNSVLKKQDIFNDTRKIVKQHLEASSI